MVVLRAMLIFLLGIGFACGVYYAGGMNWMSDYWSSYWNAPPSYVPAPAPVATYPGVPPATRGEPAVAPYPPGQDVAAAPPLPSPDGSGADYDTGADDDTGADYTVRSSPETPYSPPGPAAVPPPDGSGADYGTGADYTPPTPETSYAPLPPVGIAPLDRSGPPLSIQVSVGRRGADTVGCVAAYTVFNATHRAVLLTPRRHDHGGPRGDTVLQPGERRVVCAADAYRARDGDPRFDYYRQNIWYGPDAIDVPPPLHIRVSD